MKNASRWEDETVIADYMTPGYHRLANIMYFFAHSRVLGVGRLTLFEKNFPHIESIQKAYILTYLFTYVYLNRPSLVVAKADSTLHRYSLATGQPLSSTREPINIRLYQKANMKIIRSAS